VDAILNRLLVEPFADVHARTLLELAMGNFYAFTLVLVRMSGLMTIGPVFGQSMVPANIRVLLVLTLSLLLTPTLGDQSQLGFHRLDANHDHRLARDEVPESLQAHFDSLLNRAGKTSEETLAPAEYAPRLKVPSTIVDFAWVGIGEFALGLVLGLGVLIILSGLQVAGELIDQQTGISLGEISNPGFNIEASFTGQTFYMLAVTLLLVMEPTGLHLMMISAMVETFQTLPVGEAFINPATIDLLGDLVHQSLVLGVQVAAPLLATMSLLALTMGFLGHTVPQLNVLVVGFPVRAVMSLFVLSLGLTGVGRSVVDVVPAVIDALRTSLTGL
jgi:flagellar biosynthetic protein FliR